MDIVITIEFVICLSLGLGVFGFLIRRLKSTRERGRRKRT